jgi:Na+/melibiose symporter-like transporter
MTIPFEKIAILDYAIIPVYNHTASLQPAVILISQSSVIISTVFVNILADMEGKITTYSVTYQFS